MLLAGQQIRRQRASWRLGTGEAGLGGGGALWVATMPFLVDIIIHNS